MAWYEPPRRPARRPLLVERWPGWRWDDEGPRADEGWISGLIRQRIEGSSGRVIGYALGMLRICSGYAAGAVPCMLRVGYSQGILGLRSHSRLGTVQVVSPLSLDIRVQVRYEYIHREGQVSPGRRGVTSSPGGRCHQPGGHC